MVAVNSPNPLITSPFVDADEATYAEVPIGKELEVRVAAVPAGSGSLHELRQSTGGIVEAERVGEKVDELNVTTGWTTDTNCVLSAVADVPAGYTGNAFQIAATTIPLSTTRAIAKTGLALNLSEYSGGAQSPRIQAKVTSLTNLASLRIRFQTDASNWAEYNIVPSAINTWEIRVGTRSAPAATGGTVNWASITAIHVRITTSGAGTYTGNVLLRDMRYGANPMTIEATYEVRVRYRDAATPTTFGAWSDWLQIKPSVAPVVTAGAAVDVNDPAPTIDWAWASAGGKAQASYQVKVYANVTGQLVHDSGLVASAATDYVIPGYILDNALAYRADVVAYDTDGLAGSLAIGAWTTAFTAPPALTGLVATPDLDASEVDLAWAVPWTLVEYAPTLTPAAWWRVNETTGTAADNSGNGHTATYVGCTLGVAGLVAGDTDKAVQLTGTGSSLTVPEAAWLDFTETGSFAIAAVVRHDSFANPGTYFPVSKGGGTLASQPRLEISEGHTDGSVVSIQLADGTNQVSASLALDAGYNDAYFLGRRVSWIYVIDRTAGKFKVYIDGVKMANEVGIAAVTGSLANAANLLIGNTAGWFLNGVLDEPMLISGVPTQAQIDALVASQMVGGVSNAHFWRYRIYRRDRDTGELVLIGEVADKTTPAFSDQEAPHGVSIDYAVTVSNGWAEGEAITISTVLRLGWWIVTPTDPALTFEVLHATGFDGFDDHQQAALRPLGRDTPLVVSGELLAPSGTLSVDVLPEDAGIIPLIRRAAKIDPWVVLKGPFGEVLRVKLGSIRRTQGEAGKVALAVTYQTVA